ncbi:MAG: hypothetical protein QXO92_00245 [Candidatus Bathyarchaeia archaeon]
MLEDTIKVKVKVKIGIRVAMKVKEGIGKRDEGLQEADEVRRFVRLETFGSPLQSG